MSARHLLQAQKIYNIHMCIHIHVCTCIYTLTINTYLYIFYSQFEWARHVRLKCARWGVLLHFSFKFYICIRSQRVEKSYICLCGFRGDANVPQQFTTLIWPIEGLGESIYIYTYIYAAIIRG